jgi:hypothetical protein
MSSKPSLVFDIGANTGQPERGTVHQLSSQARVPCIQASFRSLAPNKPVSRRFISIRRMSDVRRFVLCATAVMGLAIYKDLPAMGVIVCAALALAFARKGSAPPLTQGASTAPIPACSAPNSQRPAPVQKVHFAPRR